jgi:integrase
VLALRWADVDLLVGELQVRATWGRNRTLTEPKTRAGRRTVPLSPGLVDLLVSLKPEDAEDEQFVFSTSGAKPIEYWNFRDRGWVPALKAAGLADKGLVIHDLRSAAASLLIAKGLSPVDVATVLGHTDANITLRVYARLFDKREVDARVRAAQAEINIPTSAGSGTRGHDDADELDAGPV